MPKNISPRREATRKRCKAEAGLLVILVAAAVSSFSLFYVTPTIENRELLGGIVVQQTGYEQKKAVKTPNTEDTYVVTGTGIQEGVRSDKPPSFFRKIQNAMDSEDWQERCTRYGEPIGSSNGKDNVPKKRKIFYGSLIGDEPWELFEIMGTETYGLFEGMVFVESNRTQSFDPRPFQHNEATRQRIQKLFGTPQLEIRQFINEDHKLEGLDRENTQRQEILKAWKDMGMGPEDIGYIADVDETFSRDFLLAVKTCPYVAPLDYESHKCNLQTSRIKGRAIVYEGSPECIAKRRWQKPDMMIGACIEGIGDSMEHPLAERDGFRRKIGYASGDGMNPIGSPGYRKNHAHITGEHYPLWSAGDFRTLGQGVQIENSAFHLHNWLANFGKIRHKYLTYGHPIQEAMTAPIHSIHNDLKLMAYCLHNLTDAPTPSQKKNNPRGNEYTEVQGHHRVEGGFLGAPKPWPIYFYDDEYRRRKHEAAKTNLEQDENQRQEKLTPHQWAQESLLEAIREARRQVWMHDLKRHNEEAQAARRHVKELESRWLKSGMQASK